jgi:hypothetical protein
MDREFGSVQIPRTKPGSASRTPRPTPTPTWDRDLYRHFTLDNPKYGLGKDYYWVSDASGVSRSKSRRQIRVVSDPITLNKFLVECAARNIEVMFLIAHASDQLQPLYLLTLAIMKQTFLASKFNRAPNSQSNKVVRMLGAWLADNSPHQNVEAFMSMGLIPMEHDGRLFVMVHPEKPRRVSGVREVEPAGEMFPPDAHSRFRLPTAI